MFNYHIQTSISIKANPETVWAILSDFQSYPEWNPFISKIEGVVLSGNTIEVEAGGMTFKPKVLSYELCKELNWLGSLGFKGIFDGKHTLKIALEDGHSVLVHEEHFSGLLIPIFKKWMAGKTKEGFIQMNKALKKRVEASFLSRVG